MGCKHKEQVIKYLNEENIDIDENIIEKHLEECEECSNLLNDKLSDKLFIPEEKPEDDNKLIQRIKNRRKGIKRITLFTIAGFILGLLSFFYTQDKFLITKILMAIPYKMSEGILSIIMPKGSINFDLIGKPAYVNYGYGVFPHFTFLAFIAERLNPAFIGAGIYGSLGYFSGDRRVFTFKKYLRYLIMGIVILVIWLGGLYGVYHYSTENIYNLEDIKEIQIVNKRDGAQDIFVKEEIDNRDYIAILNSIDHKKSVGKGKYETYDSNVFLVFDFGLGRTVTAKVDFSRDLILLDNNKAYRIRKDTFSRIERIVGGGEYEK